jgi:hypothetical protein
VLSNEAFGPSEDPQLSSHVPRLVAHVLHHFLVERHMLQGGGRLGNFPLLLLLLLVVKAPARLVHSNPEK